MFLVKGPCILYQSSRFQKANDSDFIKYFPWGSMQVIVHKANIMSSSTCYWPEAWLDVIWDLHRKEPKHLWFIFHTLDGREGGWGKGFDFTATATVFHPMLNSKRVAKASLLYREVWYAFRCERHRMLNPDCAVTAKLYSCRAQILHYKAIDGNSKAMDQTRLFLQRLNYSFYSWEVLKRRLN